MPGSEIPPPGAPGVPGAGGEGGAANAVGAKATDAAGAASSTRLMHRLDAFHEQVYQNVKDRVSDKNDIIEEVAKLLFLESFRCHHGADLGFDYKGQRLNFREVFAHAYVQTHGALAVEQIQTAFDQLKSHPDYVITADDGTQSPIFDPKTHLRLTQPKNYETLLDAIQNLGAVTDNQGRPIPGKEHGTLADVSGDVLGRVFDVFLRANFESKGGLGVYLTPNPVKQAMLDIAFHDIQQDPEAVQELVAGAFRFCDPTCGSFGFGSVALSRLRSLIWVSSRASPTWRRSASTRRPSPTASSAPTRPRAWSCSPGSTWPCRAPPRPRSSTPTTP